MPSRHLRPKERTHSFVSPSNAKGSRGSTSKKPEPEQSFLWTQDVFKQAAHPINVISLREYLVTSHLLDDFLDSATDARIGLNSTYDQKYGPRLSGLAISTSTYIILVRFARLETGTRGSIKAKGTGNQLLQSKILFNLEYENLAFDMERLSTALYLDQKLHISNAIDLQSLRPDLTPRSGMFARNVILGGVHSVEKANVVCLCPRYCSA